jgi:hypothetical protein
MAMVRGSGRKAKQRATMVMQVIVAFLLMSTGGVSAQQVRLGPEVVVSINKDGGRLRVEPSAIIVGETVVVAWNDSRAGRDFKVATGVGLAWARSTNGGRSFDFGGYLPSPDEATGPSGADSWLAATRNGEILLQLLHWGDDKQEVRVYALPRDGDAGWKPRGVAVTGTRVDKPAMATAGDNWIGVAYTSGSAIGFVRSIDAGATWADPVSVSALDTRTRTGVGVASCGSQVLVVWLEGKGLVLDEIWFAWSVDGGRSFSKAAKVRSLDTALTPPPGYALGVGPAAFISNNAWLACSGGQAPLFHLVYAEGRTRGSVILYQQARPQDGQLQWGKPQVVAGGDSVWAVFPSVAVFEEWIGVLYYSSRHSTASHSVMDVYLSIGLPGAFADHRLTTVSTSWPDVAGDPEHAPVQRNFGDYITLASDGLRGVAAWTDGRTGEPRIMVRKLDVMRAGPPNDLKQ